MRSAELMSGDYIHPLKLLSSAACRYMANNFSETTPLQTSLLELFYLPDRSDHIAIVVFVVIVVAVDIAG